MAAGPKKTDYSYQIHFDLLTQIEFFTIFAHLYLVLNSFQTNRSLHLIQYFWISKLSNFINFFIRLTDFVKDFVFLCYYYYKFGNNCFFNRGYTLENDEWKNVFLLFSVFKEVVLI